MKFQGSLILFLLIWMCLDGKAQSTEGKSVVFSDDFRNNKNGWFTSMSGSNRSRVNNDMEFLIIGVNDKGSIERSWVNTDIDFNKDFVLKASIKSETKSGAKTETVYGLLVGLSDIKYRSEQGFYGFRLFSDEDKAWMYATNDNGTRFFKKETENPASYTADDYSEIAIERKDDKIMFYLNGVEIYSNEATTTSAGSIYFEARNIQKAYLNKLEIYQ